MLVADGAQGTHQFRRGRHETALADDRLDDERSHARGFDVVLEQIGDVLQGVGHGHAVIRMREAGMEDVGRERTETDFVGGDFAGQAKREQRAAVVTATEGNHARALGVSTRDLDGILNRFGAGGDEQGFGFAGNRGALVQFLGQFNVGFIGHDLEAAVHHAFQLLLDAGHHFRMAVTGVHDPNATGEIDVTPSIGVPDFSVFSTHGEQLGGVTDATGDGINPALLQLGIFAHSHFLNRCLIY